MNKFSQDLTSIETTKRMGPELMGSPVLFSNVYPQRLVLIKKTQTHSYIYFLNKCFHVHFISLCNNYAPKYVMFYAILIDCVPLIIVMITQLEDLEY